MIRRADLIAEARTWLGTPWIHQASLKGVGSDCIGLVLGVAMACGVPNAAAFKADPRFQGYGRQPDPRMLLKACAEYFDPVDPAQAQVGDVLLIRYAEEPMHFALVTSLDPPYMIHALGSLGRVAEHGLDAVWRSRVMRAFAYKGVE